MSENGELVQLYVYDLSRGMARQFSPAFLGKQIDGIWHSAIVVGGTEYYFGYGINVCIPGQSPFGQPSQVYDLGVTFIPEDIRDEFLADLSERYTPQAYNLLHNNCNNFSNELAQLLVGTGIPEHIAGLPAEVLATPFGQMIRPMLQGMEQQLGSVHQQRFVPHQPHPHAEPAASTVPFSALAAGKLQERQSPNHQGTEGQHQLTEMQQLQQAEASGSGTVVGRAAEPGCNYGPAVQDTTDVSDPTKTSSSLASPNAAVAKGDAGPSGTHTFTGLQGQASFESRQAASAGKAAHAAVKKTPALDAAVPQALVAGGLQGDVQEAEERRPAAAPQAAFPIAGSSSRAPGEQAAEVGGVNDVSRAAPSARSAFPAAAQKQPPARSAAAAAAAAAAERRAQAAAAVHSQTPGDDTGGDGGTQSVGVPGTASTANDGLGKTKESGDFGSNCEESVRAEFTRLMAAGQMSADEAAAVAACNVAAMQRQSTGTAEAQA